MSDTIRKGIVDVTIYNGSESQLMVGELAALGGEFATGKSIVYRLFCGC